MLKIIHWIKYINFGLFKVIHVFQIDKHHRESIEISSHLLQSNWFALLPKKNNLPFLFVPSHGYDWAIEEKKM